MKKLSVLVLALVMILLAMAPAYALPSIDQYASCTIKKAYSVYSGPGEHYYRANNGKAMYGGAGSVRVFGVTGDWILMGYGLSNGDYRVGYVPAEGLNYISNLRGDINYNLTFGSQVMYTNGVASISDDPIVKGKMFADIPADTQVIALATMGNWTYVELTLNGKPTRGFVYSYLLRNGDGSAPVAPAPAPVVTAAPTAQPQPVYTAAPVQTGNSLLSSLSHNCPNTGIMVPERFSPYQTHYLLTVADWVSRPTFTPVTYDSNATIVINGRVIRSGQTYQGITMTDEPQVVTIQVTSGSSTTTYTVYLQRRPSEKRTRVSAGYISRIYQKNGEWRIAADLGTVSYLSSDYSTGSRSSFSNKEYDSYDYVVSPNCLFYYGAPGSPIRLHTVNEFMANYQAFGNNLYTLIYIEDEIVAVIPYGVDESIYY